MNQPVLFLDRDGTINVDKIGDYIHTPAETQLIPGAGWAIARAIGAGFKISVITNQAGVAKGLTKAEALPKIHKRLEELIAREAGLASYRFDDLRVCLHHPDEKCRCRKPGTLMVEESMAKLGADLSRSWFVGDKLSDLQCGEAAGMRSILVRTGHGRMAEEALAESGAGGNPLANPEAIVDDLEQAVAFVLAHDARPSR